jgi:polyisoprenoid-binding protein YceI
MSYRIALLMISLCAVPAIAADTYTLDSSHAFPRWQISHFGFSTHHGQFNKTSGKLTLDPKAGKGSVEVVVDAASIATGDPELEKHLRSVDFFNVEKFPTLTFKSKSMKFENGKPVSAAGDFTMLGVTKPMTFRIAQVKCGMHPVSKKESCGAEVSGTLKRSVFGMTYGAPALGDTIKLTIQVEAAKD